jgi:F-type H+-transporting ATPase subunit delta
MPDTASAKRYAQAIFDLALERQQLDRWAEGLDALCRAMENRDMFGFLEHAKVTMPQKVRTIEEALPDVDPLLRNLLCVLVDRGLAELVPEVEKGYRRLLDAHMGREQVQVSSAVPLEDSEQKSISEFISGLIRKEVVMETRVDPSILGGLVIRVGDRLIDGSTRTRLAEMGKRLRQGAIEANA